MVAAAWRAARESGELRVNVAAVCVLGPSGQSLCVYRSMVCSGGFMDEEKKKKKKEKDA